MIIPYLLIFAGLYLYYYNFGWTFHVTSLMPMYGSAFLVLIGLFIIFNSKKSYF